MKNVKFDLRTFLARRKTTLSKLMQSKGITASELNAWCNENNLTAPDAELLATLKVKKALPAAKPKAAKKKVSKKKTSKKKVQAKKTATTSQAPVAMPAVESKEADTQDTPAVPAPNVSKTASTRIS